MDMTTGANRTKQRPEKPFMHNGNELDDPIATARLTLAAEDREYWLAHPELQGLVAHFTAKVLQHRPNDVQAFARETFSSCNLKEQVQKAIARNGSWYSHGEEEQQQQQQQQRREAAGISSRRARQDGGKRRIPKEKSSRDETSRGERPGGRISSSGNTASRAKAR